MYMNSFRKRISVIWNPLYLIHEGISYLWRGLNDEVSTTIRSIQLFAESTP